MGTNAQRIGQIRRAALVASLVASSALLASCSSSTPAAKLTVPQLLREGVKLENQGKNSAARKDFQKILASKHALTNGYGAVAYYNIGLLDQKANDVASAVLNYNRAIALAPDYSPALFNLAIIESSASPASSIALYKRVLVLQPTNANAMFNLGLIYYTTGNKTLGRSYLRKAIKITASLVKRLPATVTL